MQETTSPRRQPMKLALTLLLIAACAWGLVYARTAKSQHDQTANYAISRVGAPDGWKQVPHGPQTLFLYRDHKTNLLMRGAVNQVIADYNPTPELYTDGIADHFVDLTVENQPDWKATKLDTVDADGTTFRLIRRERKGKCVVTAFAVKGNTTFMVSLSGNGGEINQIDGEMPAFRAFLHNIKLTEKDMSAL